MLHFTFLQINPSNYDDPSFAYTAPLTKRNIPILVFILISETSAVCFDSLLHSVIHSFMDDSERSMEAEWRSPRELRHHNDRDSTKSAY